MLDDDGQLVKRIAANDRQALSELYVAGVVVTTISTQDPAIELQLTMPGKYHMTALRRLSLIVGWTTLVALLSSITIHLFHLEWEALQLQSYAAPLQFILGLLA